LAKRRAAKAARVRVRQKIKWQNRLQRVQTPNSSAKKTNVKSSLQRRANPNRAMQHAAPQRAPTQTAPSSMQN